MAWGEVVEGSRDRQLARCPVPRHPSTIAHRPLTALSTCWRTRKHRGVVSLIQETRKLGFEAIEVSHGFPVDWLPKLLKWVEDGEIKVAGVHNFCPSPVEVTIDAPDIYEITDYRAPVRQRAMNQTRKTLEFAARLEAEYCVFHAGSVPMPKMTEKLEALAAAGRLNSREFVRCKHAMIRKREKLGRQLLPRVLASLEQIAVWAEEFGVPVGVESRSHFEQFPIRTEFRQLFEHFADNPWIGYWHDFGHVQRKHNLALLDHGQWLEEISPVLLGGHLHDVEWPKRDHRVPLCAGTNFEALMPHFPANRWLVWELSPSCQRAQVELAREAWQLKFEPMRREAREGDKHFGAVGAGV